MLRREVQNVGPPNHVKKVEQLAKKPGNNICADCKQYKAPRWASWKLGIFICMQCAGIHRGLGVHISKVKSVDLDKWDDEAWKTMERWGNMRANMYWEAKLGPNHRRNDDIRNFIKQKYEFKRWVMDAQRPEPETLDDGRDEDVPLNVVQQKVKLERESSLRNGSSSSRPVPPPPKAPPPVDLFGDVPSLPVRPSTTDVPSARPPPPKPAAAPKPTKASDSLLNLDFFGAPPPATSARPSSSASTPAGSTDTTRKDLSKAILSLYTVPSKAPQHERQPSFTAMQSPPVQQQVSGSNDFNSAFSDLNFNPPTSPPSQAPKSQQPPKHDPFANFSKPTNQRSSAAPPQLTSPPMSGGGFFNTGHKLASQPSIASKPPQKPTPKADPLASADFDGFSLASTTAPAPSKPIMSNASNDLFDFSEPSPPAHVPQPSPAPSQKPSVPAASSTNSAFNLSALMKSSQPAAKPAPPAHPAPSITSSGLSNMDAWGSSDAWATPEPATTISAPKTQPAAPARAPSIPMSNDFSAWGGSTAPTTTQSNAFSNGFGGASQPTATVAQDEDFGGWSSAAPPTPAASNPLPQQSKSAGNKGGFSGSDDLFSNVWE